MDFDFKTTSHLANGLVIVCSVVGIVAAVLTAIYFRRKERFE